MAIFTLRERLRISRQSQNTNSHLHGNSLLKRIKELRSAAGFLALDLVGAGDGTLESLLLFAHQPVCLK